MSDYDMLPEAVHEQWHRFIEGLNGVLHDVYGEDLPAIVVGLQPEGLQGETDRKCLVTSNLPICLTADAVVDMHEEAVRLHEYHHGGEDGISASGNVVEPVSFDALPESVKEQVRAFAEANNIDLATSEFGLVADASDLAEVEQFVRGEN